MARYAEEIRGESSALLSFLLRVSVSKNAASAAQIEFRWTLLGVGLNARTSASSLPDQETHSCGDRESWRDQMQLSQRDSKYADYSDEDQVNGEQQHSDVLFHVIEG